MTARNLFIAGVAVSAIFTGLWFSLQLAKPPPRTTSATLFPEPGELPEFSLLDQNGNAIDRTAFDGQWDLLYFGYTNCPDVCPLTLAELAKVRKQLIAAGKEAPRIVFVSVDPERDTPDVVAKYVTYFGDGNLGITGNLDQIRKFAKGLGIFFAKGREEGGIYSVDHSSVVLVVDPQARLRALFSAPHKADDYLHDLPIIMARG
jgi:protein SCO1